MLSNKKNNLSYDPVTFVKNNIHVFSPNKGTKFVSVNFSGFKRKPFQSGNRPCGTIKIIFKDENKKLDSKKFFLKKHSDAPRAFDNMKNVYNKLKDTGSELHTNMPIPLICDKKNKVIYTEYINGTPLNIYTAKQLFFQRNNNEKLSNLFLKIVEWLAQYHKVFDLNEKIYIEEYINKIKSRLKYDNFFFNENDKLSFAYQWSRNG